MEPRFTPTWDRTRENQMYVRRQKVPGERPRFDKTSMGAFLPPEITAAQAPQAARAGSNCTITAWKSFSKTHFQDLGRSSAIHISLFAGYQIGVKFRPDSLVRPCRRAGVTHNVIAPRSFRSEVFWHGRSGLSSFSGGVEVLVIAGFHPNHNNRDDPQA
jgi:hypothetical protein